MANIGLSTFLYGELTEDGAGKATYAAPEKLAGAIECKVSLETNSAELYSDDSLNDSDYTISKGTLTLGIDDDDTAVFGPLFGKTEIEVESAKGGKAYQSKNSDVAKFVGFGYVASKNHGVYKAHFFPKVKFKDFIADTKTKADKLEFTTPSVEGVFSSLLDGTYHVECEFDDKTAAVTYLKSLFVTK